MRIADNDNLPQLNMVATSFQLGWQAFRPSLIIALWAVLLQMGDSLTNGATSSLEIAATLAVSAIAAPLVQLALAERSVRKCEHFIRFIKLRTSLARDLLQAVQSLPAIARLPRERLELAAIVNMR